MEGSDLPAGWMVIHDSSAVLEISGISVKTPDIEERR